MSTVNSHIQITKSLLENFSHKTNEGQKVFYLDLYDNEIKEEKIKKLGTKYGYYSDKVEEYLNKEIETKIGNVAKRFRDFYKKKNLTLEITEEEEKSIKKFFKYSIIRSTAVLKTANKASRIGTIFGVCTTNNIISFVDDSLLPDPFEEYYTNILINVSDIELVIPRNCFYSVMFENKPTNYVLPISPRVAFILIHNSELNRYIASGRPCYPRIEDNDTVANYNKRALLDEKYYNNAFIAANRKEELESLKMI